MMGVMWSTFEILGLYIFGTVVGKNFKFGMNCGTPPPLYLGNSKCGTNIDRKELYRKYAKVGQKGTWRGHVTHFCNFGTPYIPGERLKLETSNLTWKLKTMSIIKNAKLGRKGVVHSVNEVVASYIFSSLTWQREMRQRHQATNVLMQSC